MKIIVIIGIVVIMLGVILIYDARQFVKKIFSYSDQNNATFVVKILGFILAVIGSFCILVY